MERAALMTRDDVAEWLANALADAHTGGHVRSDGGCRCEQFSLEDALSLFRGMSEYGTGAPDRIECPDGTVITDSGLWN